MWDGGERNQKLRGGGRPSLSSPAAYAQGEKRSRKGKTEEGGGEQIRSLQDPCEKGSRGAEKGGAGTKS